MPVLELASAVVEASHCPSLFAFTRALVSGGCDQIIAK
jgi:hypothetical protein